MMRRWSFVGNNCIWNGQLVECMEWRDQQLQRTSRKREREGGRVRWGVGLPDAAPREHPPVAAGCQEHRGANINFSSLFPSERPWPDYKSVLGCQRALSPASFTESTAGQGLIALMEMGEPVSHFAFAQTCTREPN